jgi:hypothetical protein
MKVQKAKFVREADLRKMGPNRPKKGAGRPAWSDRLGPFLWRFGPPLTYPLFGAKIAPASDDRHIHSPESYLKKEIH